MPEDIVLITSGALASTGYIDMYVAMVLTYTAILLGDSISFTLGYIYGDQVLESRPFRRFVSEKKLKKAKKIMNNNSWYICFLSRFLPGLRTIMFVTAGAVRIKPYIYLSMNGSAALISAPAFVYLGYWAGTNFTLVKSMLKNSQSYVFIGIALLLTYLIFKVFFESKEKF